MRRPVFFAAASLASLTLLGTACEPDTGTPPPTAAPTTAAPTTAAPTTAAPTTAPTTVPTTTTRPSTTTTTAAPTTTRASTTTTTAAPGSTPAFGSCLLTPANSFWHANVQGLPVAAGSATWIGEQSTRSLKADFGSGLWDGDKIGIPYNVVGGSQPKVTVTFGDYADESDPGPYPIPANAQIEGANGTGDRHVLVVDQDNCRLYETGNSYPNGDGTWRASGGATWNLTSNATRPLGWTSSDAAGLPILPGLVRYDEVASGSVNHVIRITMPSTAGSYVWPATHKARSGASTLPMGSWMRLKPNVDLSRVDPAVRPIAVALQRYGAVVADNGSAFYLSGAPDERWNNDKLQTLGTIKGSDFEFVDASSLMVSPSSYQTK